VAQYLRIIDMMVLGMLDLMLILPQGNNTSSQNKLEGVAGSYAKTMLTSWPRQRFELLPNVADCDGTPGNGKN
jgi:hypothetical protein